MSWSLYRWTWQLESPLYVGLPPAGSVNRCRLYVTARAVWGAVTAELARAAAEANFPDYQNKGKELSEHARFTYLFPAEQGRQNWRAWLPRYEKDAGLVWHREDNAEKKISDRQLRMRLLSTRPATAIEPSSDTAAEGSLRETECINTFWRCEGENTGTAVGLVGYVFVSSALSSELRSRLEQVDWITVGGDTRYGLGRLQRIHWEDTGAVFGYRVNLGNTDPSVKGEYVLGHAKALADAKGALWGALELLGGWDGKKDWTRAEPLWAPGSGGAPGQWRIESDGHWCLAGSGQ
jgi:hypothetical protein